MFSQNKKLLKYIIYIVVIYTLIWLASAFLLKKTFIDKISELSSSEFQIKFDNVDLGGFPHQIHLKPNNVEININNLNNFQAKYSFSFILIKLNPFRFETKISFPKENFSSISFDNEESKYMSAFKQTPEMLFKLSFMELISQLFSKDKDFARTISEAIFTSKDSKTYNLKNDSLFFENQEGYYKYTKSNNDKLRLFKIFNKSTLYFEDNDKLNSLLNLDLELLTRNNSNQVNIKDSNIVFNNINLLINGNIERKKSELHKCHLKIKINGINKVLSFIRNFDIPLDQRLTKNIISILDNDKKDDFLELEIKKSANSSFHINGRSIETIIANSFASNFTNMVELY